MMELIPETLSAKTLQVLKNLSDKIKSANWK